MLASAAKANAAMEMSKDGVEASVEAETVVEEEKTAVSEVEEKYGRDVLGRQYSEKVTITQADIAELRSIGKKSVNAFTSEDIKKPSRLLGGCGRSLV